MTDKADKVLDELRKKRTGYARRYKVRLIRELHVDVTVPADDKEHVERILSNALMPDARRHLVETAEWKSLDGGQFKVTEPRLVEDIFDKDIPDLSELLSSINESSDSD